jgi:predicted Zn-dependent protease/general stress protein YciG
MKRTLALSVVLASLVATPAFAQLGGIGKRIGQAKDARDKTQKVLDLKVNDNEERQLGEKVSAQLRQDFGVYQDAAVTKYVSLVGAVLAQGSSRPGLNWTFIVLDTDGVNAFASPGGFVHITRGALGLIKNEAELAGILGHEITHVTAKHTVRSIEKGEMVELGAEQAGNGMTAKVLSRMADAAYKNIINNKFDRNDEDEADREGIALADKAGYAPGALADVLTRIEARNSDRQEPNGLFASHPIIKDRLGNIAKEIRNNRLDSKATVASRYAKQITFDVKPLSQIPVIAGSRGLTGGDSKDAKGTAAKTAADKSTKEEPKKKGGLLGKVGLTGGSQGQNTQTVASAGARGGVPDRDATGGANPNKVNTPVTPAEIAAFKKGIA